MKRELIEVRRDGCVCCPVHDKFPCQSYRNRRSKHARSEGKKLEHRIVRRIKDRQMMKELSNEHDKSPS